MGRRKRDRKWQPVKEPKWKWVSPFAAKPRFEHDQSPQAMKRFHVAVGRAESAKSKRVGPAVFGFAKLAGGASYRFIALGGYTFRWRQGEHPRARWFERLGKAMNASTEWKSRRIGGAVFGQAKLANGRARALGGHRKLVVSVEHAQASDHAGRVERRRASGSRGVARFMCHGCGGLASAT